MSDGADGYLTAEEEAVDENALEYQLRRYLFVSAHQESLRLLSDLETVVRLSPFGSVVAVPRFLLKLFKDLGKPTLYGVRVGFRALKVLQLFCPEKGGSPVDQRNCHDFFQALSVVCAFVLLEGVDRDRQTLRSKLSRLLKLAKVDEMVYFDKMTSVDGFNVSLICGFLYKIWSDSPELRKKCLPRSADVYVRDVLLARHAPPETIVLEYWGSVIEEIRLDLFLSKVYTPMKKAILRSPEAGLIPVGYFFKQTCLEMSCYVESLMSELSPHLYSSQRHVREGARHAVCWLLRPVTLPNSRKLVVTLLFDLIIGPRKKATNVEQKTNIISTLGGCAACLTRLSIEDEETLRMVVDNLIALMKSEVHESVVEECTIAIADWMSTFKGSELPKSLTALFQQVFPGPANNPMTVCYLRCLGRCFTGKNLMTEVGVIKSLAGVIQAGSKASSQLVPVTAALVAADILLSNVSNFSANDDLKTVLQWVKEKHDFTSEQVMKNFDVGALSAVIRCFEKFFMLCYTDASEGSVKGYCWAMMRCLLNCDKSIRRLATQCIQRCQKTLSGESLCLLLLDEYHSVVSALSKGQELADVTGNPGVYVNTLKMLTCIQDACTLDQLLLKALHCSVLPFVYNADPVVWKSILRTVKREPAEFLAERSAQISDLVLTPSEGAMDTLVRTVFSNAGPETFQQLLAVVRQRILDKRLLEMSEENLALLCQPPPVPEAQPIVKKIAKEKKGKEASTKSGRSKAKAEDSHAELIERRNGLLTIVNEVSRALDMLKCILSCGSPLVSGIVKEMMVLLEEVLHCQPVADRAYRCYLCLCPVAFPRKDIHLAQAIAHATLRLWKVACELDTAWTELPLEGCLETIIKHLLAETKCCSPVDDILAPAAAKEPLPSSAFAFCFPLVKHGLTTLLKREESSERVCELLDFIAVHIGQESWDSDLFNVENIPGEEIVEMACSMIQVVTDVRVQTLLISCLRQLVDIVVVVRDNPTVRRICCIFLKHSFACIFSTLNQALKESLMEVIETIVTAAPNDLPVCSVADICILRFDPDQGIASIAERLWPMCPTVDILEDMLNRLDNQSAEIRETVALAMGERFKDGHIGLADVLQRMDKMFVEKSYITPRVTDDFGRLIQEGGEDRPAPRLGIAAVFKQLLLQIKSYQFPVLFDAFTAEMFSDRDSEVRHAVLNACVEGVRLHGMGHLAYIYERLEKLLKCPAEASNDALRVAAVVLSGTLAQHLEPDDPYVQTTFVNLIDTLSVRSQLVQESVANCLPPLVKSVHYLVPQAVEKLMAIVLSNGGYGERRGAAYGVAGLIKGLGALSGRQLGVFDRIESALTDKSHAYMREGACITYEVLSDTLNRVFEPFVLNVIPKLLVCLGDPDAAVRDAASDCTKTVMKNLSTTAVKLILPGVLSGVDMESWRTKCGSLEVISSMAACAPKHLVNSLPQIVPRLVEALCNTHPKVQEKAMVTLKSIAAVIRNPEVLVLADRLIEAIGNPAEKTHQCLRMLLNTKFVHYIDAPSLALIMPVVQRGFEDRSPEARKTAAIVTGNIYMLTDQANVQSYLPSIVPGLQRCVVDPVPEIRAVSAKAMGTMVRVAGEKNFTDLLKWLRSMLVSTSSAVDRAGAAQGLSEIIGGLGVEHLERIMSEVYEVMSSDALQPCARDGYVLMLVYLPSVFGDRFVPYLSGIVEIILKGLADDVEFVRNSALMAGRNIVNLYCETATPLLLPTLEASMLADSWRSRLSSLQLLSEVIFKVVGVSGKMTTVCNDEEMFGSVHTMDAMKNAVGSEHRDKILAGLYISMYDDVMMVKQTATHAWKLVVANTPRTLRDIMPTLFNYLLQCVSCTSEEKQKIAAACLGSLVTKLGERMLLDIVPALEQGLSSDDCDQRRGVCLALSEVMGSTSYETITAYGSKLLPTILKTMCDESPEVRKAASDAFSALFVSVGSRGASNYLEPITKKLADPEKGELMLDSMMMVMETRGRWIMPILLPKLLQPPVKTRALAMLFSGAADIIYKRTEEIMGALFQAFLASVGTPKESEELENFRIVYNTIANDEELTSAALRLLRENAFSMNPPQTYAAACLFLEMCLCYKSCMESWAHELLSTGLRMYMYREERVYKPASRGVLECVLALKKEDLPATVSVFRQWLGPVFSKKAVTPAFTQEEGVRPIFMVVRECMINAKAPIKESAAYLLADLMEHCDEAAISSHVINTVGSMIRVLSDRQMTSTKVAVTTAIVAVLKMAKTTTKAFVPQLQSTFLRLLNEPSTEVRYGATCGLTVLVEIHPRPESLISDLVKAIKGSGSDNRDVTESLLVALRAVLGVSKFSLSDGVKNDLQTTCLHLSATSDKLNVFASACMGAFASNVLTDEEFTAMLDSYSFQIKSNKEQCVQRALVVFIALKTDTEKVIRLGGARVIDAVKEWLVAKEVPQLMDLALRCTAFIIIYQMTNAADIDMTLVSNALQCINHTHLSSIPTLCADVVAYIAERVVVMDQKIVQMFVDAMLTGVELNSMSSRTASKEALYKLFLWHEDRSVFSEFVKESSPEKKEKVLHIVDKIEESYLGSLKPVVDLDFTLKILTGSRVEYM